MNSTFYSQHTKINFGFNSHEKLIFVRITKQAGTIEKQVGNNTMTCSTFVGGESAVTSLSLEEAMSFTERKLFCKRLNGVVIQYNSEKDALGIKDKEGNYFIYYFNNGERALIIEFIRAFVHRCFASLYNEAKKHRKKKEELKILPLTKEEELVEF